MTKKTHGVQLLVRFRIHSKNGRLKYDSGQRPSQCFLLQFLKALHAYLQAGTISLLDTGNSPRTVPNTLAGYSYADCVPLTSIGSGDSSRGIVVGLGSGSVDNDDYTLETQCIEGTGANEFLHGSQAFTLPDVVAGNVDFVMERQFTNGSSAPITVEEVGIYCRIRDTAGFYRYFCLVRDLTGGITVGIGEVLTIEYTWRTTV